MSYEERHALFRTHASAVFDGEPAEAHRLRQLIYPDHALAHQVFVFALFTTCLDDHFGSELDWSALGVLVERVRTAYPAVSPLKTEALIRVCYGEAELYPEVPQCEHDASMWAVCRLVVGAGRTEKELAALYERAEEFGRETVRRVFASPQLHGWRDEPERTGPTETGCERIEPEKVEPTGTGSEGTEQDRTEPTEAGPGQTEPGRPESERSAPKRAESDRAEPKRAESDRVEPEETGPEHFRSEPVGPERNQPQETRPQGTGPKANTPTEDTP